MLSPTAMQLAAAALVCGLAIAVLLPAPAANEDGLLTALLGTVCCATLLMGGLALAGLLTGTALLAATGAALMVPCAWLARAPEAPFYAEEWEEEDDDGGGSPPAPRDPSPPPGPEHWQPAPAPAALFVAKARTALAPQPGIAPAQARTALAAQHAPGSAAAAAAAPPAGASQPANPRFPYLAAVAWPTEDRPAPPVIVVPPVVAPAPVVVAPVPPAPVPATVFEAPAVRLERGEHASVEHRVAPEAPAVRRRRHFTRLRLPHGWRRRRWFVHSSDSERAAR